MWVDERGVVCVATRYVQKKNQKGKAPPASKKTNPRNTTKIIKITKSNLVDLMEHFTEDQAARQLRVSKTTIKNACRMHGIYSWESKRDKKKNQTGAKPVTPNGRGDGSRRSNSSITGSESDDKNSTQLTPSPADIPNTNPIHDSKSYSTYSPIWWEDPDPYPLHISSFQSYCLPGSYPPYASLGVPQLTEGVPGYSPYGYAHQPGPIFYPPALGSSNLGSSELRPSDQGIPSNYRSRNYVEGPNSSQPNGGDVPPSHHNYGKPDSIGTIGDIKHTGKGDESQEEGSFWDQIFSKDDPSVDVSEYFDDPYKANDSKEKAEER